jgi:hypothetical protein
MGKAVAFDQRWPSFFLEIADIRSASAILPPHEACSKNGNL